MRILLLILVSFWGFSAVAEENHLEALAKRAQNSASPTTSLLETVRACSNVVWIKPVDCVNGLAGKKIERVLASLGEDFRVTLVCQIDQERRFEKSPPVTDDEFAVFKTNLPDELQKCRRDNDPVRCYLQKIERHIAMLMSHDGNIYYCSIGIAARPEPAPFEDANRPQPPVFTAPRVAPDEATSTMLELMRQLDSMRRRPGAPPLRRP